MIGALSVSMGAVRTMSDSDVQRVDVATPCTCTCIAWIRQQHLTRDAWPGLGVLSKFGAAHVLRGAAWRRGSVDTYAPLHTCGDGVVYYGVEYCDALPSQSPYAGGPSLHCTALQYRSAERGRMHVDLAASRASCGCMYTRLPCTLCKGSCMQQPNRQHRCAPHARLDGASSLQHLWLPEPSWPALHSPPPSHMMCACMHGPCRGRPPPHPPGACNSNCTFTKNVDAFSFEFAYDSGRVVPSVPPLGFPPAWQLQVRTYI